MSWGEAAIKDFIVKSVTEKDYAFTVQVAGEQWDCYYFHYNAVPGTLGFTRRGDAWFIGLFTRGHLKEEEACKQLDEARLKESS